MLLICLSIVKFGYICLQTEIRVEITSQGVSRAKGTSLRKGDNHRAELSMH